MTRPHSLNFGRILSLGGFLEIYHLIDMICGDLKQKILRKQYPIEG